MRTNEKKRVRLGRQAFTLIELMVVVAIIGILAGGVFQLLSTIGQLNHKATTTARMQRLQNAISGFYAEYGYYPPVPQYQSPDPWANNMEDDFQRPVQNLGSEEGFAKACRLACSSQPVAFEFPPVKGLDTSINLEFSKWGIQSPNSVLGSSAQSIPQDEWSEVKLFKFGLLSFLLPRVEMVGFSGESGNSDFEPHLNFYRSRQWRKNNPSSGVMDLSSDANLRKALTAQQVSENRAVARWLPNLERAVWGGRVLLGIDTREPSSSNEGQFRTETEKDSEGRVIELLAYERGGKYVLQSASVRDGWGRDFFYYSAPPHQSYRLWSSGADGKTFPPWMPINSLSSQEREWVSRWIKDDIVRFDR